MFSIDSTAFLTSGIASAAENSGWSFQMMV